MMTDVKNALHQLIDKCDNEILLSEAKEILLSALSKDWWEDLTPEDKSLVLESEIQYEQCKFIFDNDLVQQFEEWKRNNLNA